MTARMQDSRSRPRARRGAILILAAFLLVVMLAMLAFAIDIGYIVLVRSQLQVAADAAAMAGAQSMVLPRAEMETFAKDFAAHNEAGRRSVQLGSNDIEYGNWDTGSRTFTPTPTIGNAIRVTTRTDSTSGGEVSLFFGRMFGRNSFAQRASAVAMCNPRDIVFVVDLSGSMNDDTDPNKTTSINQKYAAAGYPTVGTDLMQRVYDDFSFGTYPGEETWIGKPLGVSSSNSLTKLMDKNGPLSKSTIASTYRIKSNDSESTRRWKAYAWAMDVQIRAQMPAAKPEPNSASNYNYWAAYLNSYYDKIGYKSYTRFMMYHGRDLKPDGTTRTALSVDSPFCPWHSESTPGGTFSFPPREQPTHASRRSIIAAMAVVREMNKNIAELDQRDWVSVVTFDKITGAGPVVAVPLTGDYELAMRACTRLQACGDDAASTATETGLICGQNHIKKRSEGGKGRESAAKVVILLTDGKPNLYTSSNSTINSYVGAHASSNFYSSGNYASQAPLMQTMKMQLQRWQVFPVGIGLGTDYDFMDRMARIGGTASEGKSPRGSGNPAEYEQRLTDIFEKIILSPAVRLVQ